MRAIILALAFLGACSPPASKAPEAPVAAPAPASYDEALNDPRRPEEDRARDVNRKPADMLAFAEINPGGKVADLLPGGGYFTRLFAVAVGPEGRVYPTIRPDGVAGEYETPILPIAAEYPNAVMARTPYDALVFPEPLDVIFTAQNYHDMHLAEYGLGDAAGMNASAFAALKPGGYYIVIDHSATDGAPVATTQAGNHRIDEAAVRREIEAAGFVFDASSDVLRNPEDTRTQNVFDPAIRGRTDQFVLRFRKPA